MKGQVAFITGGGSGIGRAASLQLASLGVRVGVVDIDIGQAQQTVQQIEAAGGEAKALAANVADSKDMLAATNEIAGQWGRMDIVCANAGINGVLAPIEDFDEADWDRTLAVNLKGTFLTVKYCVPHMKEGGGSIIITSSVNGNRQFSGWGMTAYSTSKSGQVAFMKMAALELARYKIRVNAICPGAIDTNIDESTKKSEALSKIEIPVLYPEGSQPLAHSSGSADQVADLITFLSSPFSRHITGTKVYIDGAETLL